MAQVTKIYELKTLGYDLLQSQLDKIEQSFLDIRDVKQKLNQLAMTTTDAEKLKDLQAQLDKAKIKTKELALEKQRLTNEAKAAAALAQEEINQSKETTNQSNIKTAALKAQITTQKEAAFAIKAEVDLHKTESNSLTDLINKRKILNDLVSKTLPGQLIQLPTNLHADFGTDIVREDALHTLQAYTQAIDLYKSEIKGVPALVKAEAGSYQELVLLQKELYAQLKGAGPSTPIQFQGQTINFEQGIAEYKRLSIAEQSFRRQFQQDQVLIGEYTTGIVNAFKKMGLGDLIGTQVERATLELRRLDEEFNILKLELESIRAAGGPGLDQVEAKLIANRNAAAALDSELIRVRQDMRGMGDVGSQITTGIANGFNSIKGQLGQLILTYAGFFAVFQEGIKLIHENAQLSDSFVDLKNRIHGSSEEVVVLVDNLKKLDTRTSLKGLVDIANIVAKKGVATDEIVGITQALDKLFVVLGHEAGEPATATSSIIKLITIFNDDKHVTVERVNEIGASLFKLTTTGVATGEFLVNFAERVGAVRGITGLTLPNVLGMGAALQQLGQRAELAGTAAIQLTTKMFGNVPKFAEAAKVSVEEFRALLRSNPFDALVAVGKGLKDIPLDDIKNRFEDVVQAFDEAGIKGARIKAVLGDIATNGEFVTKRMKDAAVSTSDYGAIAAGVEAKQHTFAAVLDRIAKTFELMGTNTTVQKVLLGISTVLLTLIGNLPIILGFFGLLAIAWGVQNIALIALRLQVIGYNLALGALYITQGVLYVLQSAYTVGLVALRIALALTTVVAQGLNAVFRSTPLGLLVTGLTLLISAYSSFGQKIDGAIDKTKKLTQAQKDSIRQAQIEDQVREKASATITEQISKIESLVSVVRSASASYDTQRKALEELITINSKFSAALDGNVIDLKALSVALADVRKEIELNANAQAAASISAEQYKNYLEVVTTRQKIERAQAQGKDAGNVLNKAELDIAPNDQALRDIEGTIIIGGIRYNAKKYLEALKKIEAEALVSYQDYSKFSINLQNQVSEANADKEKAGQAKIDNQIIDISKEKLSVVDLTHLIEMIDKERDQLKEGDPKLKDLQIKRDAFQARLDALNLKQDKTATYKGARLTGEEKDRLNEIDAAMKLALAKEETRFSTLQVTDVQGVKIIHKVEYEEEVQYATNIHEINDKFLSQKINYLKGKGTLNAREKDQLAVFHKDQADEELKFLKQIESLNLKEFQDQSVTLKRNLDATKANIEERQTLLEFDPNATEEAKATGKKKADDEIIELTKNYYVELQLLADKYHINRKDLAAESEKTITDLTRKGLGDRLAITKAILADIEEASQRSISRIKAQYAKLIFEAQTAPKGNAAQKQRKVESLEHDEEELLLAATAAAAKIKLDQIRKDVAAGKATIKDLTDAETAYYEAMRRLEDSSKKPLEFLKNIKTGLQGLGQELADTWGLTGDKATLLVESFGLAEQALNSYFDNERQRLQASTNAQKTHLDLELQQRKDVAQSKLEQDSLDRQYAAKKEAIDRQAFERDKKIKREQAIINYAIQISNIAVAASANPLNAFTFGAAGIAQYILQAAIATAQFAFTLGSINSAQYAFGGNPDQSTIRGGKVKGRTHTDGGNPFMFKGRVFEDEVDELNIIRTKNVRNDLIHTISGTHTQIASKLNELGGGVAFQTGARSFASGGAINSAPVFVPANRNGIDLTPILDEIKALADEQSKRIDRMEVYQVTNTVTDAQRKQVKQKLIGSL